MADYEVGYGKPPRATQFKKGQSGNPAGRRKKEKKPIDRSLAAILKRIGEREIEVGGESFTLQELEPLAIQKKAAKGDVAASRYLSKLREEAGLLKPDERQTGVLAVPMSVSTDVWELLAAAQQARYREGQPFDLTGIVHDPDTDETGLAFAALKDV